MKNDKYADRRGKQRQKTNKQKKTPKQNETEREYESFSWGKKRKRERRKVAVGSEERGAEKTHLIPGKQEKERKERAAERRTPSGDNGPCRPHCSPELRPLSPHPV